jgi:predicted metalloprotease
MRWKGRERSENVEDRRGMSPRAMAGGGGLILIVAVGIAMLLGVDPRAVQQAVQQVQAQGQGGAQQRTEPAPDDDVREFLSVVLRDTETVWTELFRTQLGRQYQQPKLVIFEGIVDTACGRASRDVGPFYCPADQQIYIDPSFFDQLARRHHAPGDFAQAYVIAHEVAHHVQVLIGFMDKVNEVRQRGDELASNRATVRLELQADYLAGVWANHAHRNFGILEEGDMEEAIKAANQIGDDTLMRQAGVTVDQNRFTHGTSKQRVYWFSKGLKSGDFTGCQELFQVSDAELDPANRALSER